jgi:hypothetical protein
MTFSAASLDLLAITSMKAEDVDVNNLEVLQGILGMKNLTCMPLSTEELHL